MSDPVRRGNVFIANLEPTLGVEIKKKKPVVVVSNDTINQFSRLVIVVPLTTNISRLSPVTSYYQKEKAVWVRTPKPLLSR